MTDIENIRVIGCGMIAREILAVTRQLDIDHIDLKCLPAMWHHHPERIAPGVDAAIHEARAEGFEKIFVAYADCGTGGALDRICEKQGVARIDGPHCFSFYFGNEAFAAADGETDFLTTFFMTDFLARQFEKFLIEPLGLDRHPELRDMYFGNYTRLLYIAQTEDDELQEKACSAAAFLGLDYEYRFTGYGDLASAISSAA